MNKQSNLYAEITLEQIQLLYKKAMRVTAPLEASLLSGGLFNTTYHVRCKASGLDTVLRLGPINRQLLLRFEENLMEAEVYVYKRCRDRGLTCSEVLVCDTSRKWIDRDFMIVTYIPSIVMCDAELTEEQKKPLFMETGRLTKIMHGITGQSFGRVSEIISGLSFPIWSGYLASELEDICSRFIRGNGIKPEDMARARQVLAKYQGWLDEIKTPRLVHTDLWEGNILLEVQKKNRIAAVIDSDRAIFGDPDYDLSCPWMTNDTFLEGYEIETNSFHNEEFNSIKRKTRRKIYNMLYRFLDAYVGFFEYNNHELYKNNLKDAVRLVEELL